MGRPSSAARALAPKIRYCDARGPAPHATNSLMNAGDSASGARVIRTSVTAARTNGFVTGMRRTRCCSASTSSAVRTGEIARGRFDDGLLFVLGRIRHPQLEHEAVELRLGQRIGALLLDRILGGEHEKRRRQLMRLARRRHLMLLHRL